MKTAIGAREQLQSSLSLLNDLSNEARKLAARLMRQEKIEDPLEAVQPFISIFPGFSVTYNAEGHEIGLEDQSYTGIRITDENPEMGLIELCSALHDADHIEAILDREDCFIMQIASYLEKQHREDHGLVETDGLTAWVVALEASRKTKVDPEAIKQEIQSSIKDRRTPEGITAELLAYGYGAIQNKKKQSTHYNFSYATHWDYQGNQSTKSIAKTEIFPRQSYEGPQLKSRTRFSRKLIMSETNLAIECDDLPDAVIASIPGNPIEKIISEERLAGWNFECLSVDASRPKSSGKSILELIIETNRQRPECGLCFKT